MLKKMSKSMVVLTLVGVVALSSMSFADSNIGSSMQEKRANLQAEKEVIREQNAERQETSRVRLTDVINLYAPSLLGEFENAWDAHDAVHIDLLAVHKTIFEAKTQIQAYRESEKTQREAAKVEIDSIKATYNVEQGTVKALHESLKIAIDADDSAAVTSALESRLNALNQHITFDQMKLAYLNSL